MSSSSDIQGQTTLNTMVDGETRKKVTLGKGYSLMDWIKKSRDTIDLAGTNGIIRNITHDELVKHNKIDDCWMVIYDKVYNVTPYMKYHPGGIDELMKGAGMVATDLFNQVHPWVNFQSMLEKCLVGNYINPTKTILQKKETPKLTTLSVPISPISSLNINAVNDKSKIPLLDSYQTIDKAILVFYIKYPHLLNEYIIIYRDDKTNHLIIDIYLFDVVYEYSLNLPANISNNYDVKILKDSKLEISLHKIEHKNWKEIPDSLHYESKLIKNNYIGINYHLCELIQKKFVTHDTDIYTFKLPNSCRMCIPCGHHVYLRFLDDQTIIKPYTVINESLFKISENESKGKVINLMIKHYDDGTFTPNLRKLELGSKLEISNFCGNFNINKLQNCYQLICLCAGSGFTPMIKLLYISLETQIENPSNVFLFFFNKTSKDILWKSELDEFQKKHKNRFSVINVLSNPDIGWEGKSGRINKNILNELLNDVELTKPLFCICGPNPFTKTTIMLLNNIGYKDDDIHAFIT